MVTDDERARRRQAIEEARETLARTADIGEPDYLALALARPVEHPIDRDRRELGDFYQRLAQQREHKTPRPAAATDWAEIDRRCKAAAKEAALVVARETVSAMKQERTAARRELDDSVRALRVELGALDETLGELRKAIASGNRDNSSGEIIDLPARRVN